MSVRKFGILFFVGLSLLFSWQLANAQTDIFVRGSGKLFPIALPQLCADQGEPGPARDIPKIMARDLILSGYFEVIDPGSYIETPGKCGEGFAYSDWTVVGSEGLVRGITKVSGNRVTAQLFLHDVQRQKIVLGKEYEADVLQASKIAHRFANEIMRFFTGEPGVFGTKIAFSSKVGRFKELFLMDMDGSNIRQLTNDRALSVSSAWDPSGTRLVFTSYRQRQPDLFVFDVKQRSMTQITRTSGLEVGSKFGSDGNSILTSQSVNGDSDIVLLGSDGTVIKKLTSKNGAIDVSPAYSPGFNKVAFCSNRGGGPQIYVMNADGSEVKRISFVTSNYCTSPAWSPKGDRIAFVCRADGGFQLFTSTPEGGDPVQLTSGGDNEDPDWSPDGRYIVFSSTFGKGAVTSLALIRSDGSNMQQLTQSRIGDTEPSWGPLSTAE